MSRPHLAPFPFSEHQNTPIWVVLERRGYPQASPNIETTPFQMCFNVQPQFTNKMCRKWHVFIGEYITILPYHLPIPLHSTTFFIFFFRYFLFLGIFFCNITYLGIN